MKKHATGNTPLEEIARLRRMVLTREDTRAEADVLFGDEAGKMRKLDREKLEKLFIQMPGAVTMAPNLQKQARVFGASKPDDSAEGEIPYSIRRKGYESYAKAKAKEEPTSYKRSIPTGAGIGAVGGGILGAILSRSLGGTALSAAGGAALGGLAGAGATAHDKSSIEKAREAIKSTGAMDSAVASHIHGIKQHARTMKALEHASDALAAERRHREMMSSLSDRGDRGSSESHSSPAKEPKRGAGKCLNCGAPATGGSVCDHCGANDFSKYSSISPRVDAFFEKLSSPQWSEAQTRYPELQKVAYANATTKVPDLKKRVASDGTGEVKRQADLSGGSA